MSSPEWLQLDDAPAEIAYGSILNLNDDEFIIASNLYEANQNEAGIYKYNFRSKEWIFWIPYLSKTVKRDVTVNIYYKDKSIQYSLNTNPDLWTDRWDFYSIKQLIRAKFELRTFKIWNDQNEIQLEDIDDIRDEYEQNAKSFKLNLNVTSHEYPKAESKCFESESEEDQDIIILTDLSAQSLTFNAGTNKLYIVGRQSQLIIIDTKSKQVESVTSLYTIKPVGKFPYMTIIDDILHFISNINSRVSIHYFWNEKEMIAEKIFDFKNLNNLNPLLSYSIKEGSLIYAKSRNMLLLFGSAHSGWYHEHGHTVLFQYSFDTKTWNKWDKDIFDNTFEHSSTVLSYDDRYIIFVGGYGTDKIYVFDLNKCRMMETDIQCPRKGSNLVTKTSEKYESDCLVHGYVKIQMEYFDMIYNPPLDIINLIIAYHGIQETIHWIAYSKSNALLKEGDDQFKDHYVISMNDIIQNAEHKDFWHQF